ncbi:hypothetical protein ACOMHN_013369 [Nucella lapillus]
MLLHLDIQNSAVVLLCCVVVVVPLMAQTRDRRLHNRQVARRRQILWNRWKNTHGKEYTPFEEIYRKRMFFQNLRDVLRHNAKYPVSVSYVRGMNQFSDMTVEEYRTYNRLQATIRSSSICSSVSHNVSLESLPTTVDWRTKGFVTPVKNQGQCGSCWAFSTTGSVEGQHFNKTGHLLSLSEQQLVDCSGSEGNEGCNGGLAEYAFEYIMKQPGGLETESDYPYTASNGNCTAQASLEDAKIRACVDVIGGSEEALQEASALVGPISVAIDASHSSFQSYSGGVYYEPACSTTQLDHGVLMVGYGTYQGQDYWLVKNSWGKNWGLSGYLMMSRNRGNNCGIASMASYPIV